MSENAMTPEGLEALRSEIEELEGRGRAEMAKQIKTAREWGDLKENAEYHAAKEAQAHLETRILRLRDRLSKAEVVEVTGGDVVGFGSTVEVEDEDGGKRATYKLVSAGEAAPSEGRLSMQSPVAAALQGLRQGDVAVVNTPRGGRRYRVVSVS
jgi:transcription elongation factor GreA